MSILAFTPNNDNVVFILAHTADILKLFKVGWKLIGCHCFYHSATEEIFLKATLFLCVIVVIALE